MKIKKTFIFFCLAKYLNGAPLINIKSNFLNFFSPGGIDIGLSFCFKICFDGKILDSNSRKHFYDMIYAGFSAAAILLMLLNSNNICSNSFGLSGFFIPIWLICNLSSLSNAFSTVKFNIYRIFMFLGNAPVC